MNPLDDIFPPINLTEGEVQLVHEMLTNQTFRKYLAALSREYLKDLMAIETYTEATHNKVRGAMSVITTLLSTTSD